MAIWNGIAPEGRIEFYEWHNREHMPERVGIPGFRRGRRYIAKYGTPEFFTLYEADSAEVLVGQDYLNRLNNPTPLTQRVPPNFFRDTSRGICRVKLSLGVGQGGCMLTLRFGAEEGREAALEQHLRHAALPPLADIVSVVGVHLCVADRLGERHPDHRARQSQGRYPELAGHDRKRDAGGGRRSLRPAACGRPRRARRESRDGARALSAAVLPHEDAGLGVAPPYPLMRR